MALIESHFVLCLTENDNEHIFFLSWGEEFSLEKHPQVSSIFAQVRLIKMQMTAGQVTGIFCIVNVGD